MSGGQRQCVAIARTATFHSKLTIMDEPTAALGVQETAQVENIIRTLKAARRAADPDQPQHAAGLRPRRPDRRLPPRPDLRRPQQGRRPTARTSSPTSPAPRPRPSTRTRHDRAAAPRRRPAPSSPAARRASASPSPGGWSRRAARRIVLGRPRRREGRGRGASSPLGGADARFVRGRPRAGRGLLRAGRCGRERWAAPTRSSTPRRPATAAGCSTPRPRSGRS